jgi:lipoyl(octanoyl) transferase
VSELSWTVLTHRQVLWKDLEALERECVALVRADPSQAFLLFSEPTPTFTYGRNADPSHLVCDEAFLKEHYVTVAPVERGGKWTYHGPGQLLCFPIVSMGALGWPRHGSYHFAHTLRRGVQEALAAHGVETEVGNCPFGLYRGGKKLASFGIRIAHGVTSHGVSVYVDASGPFFQGIIPCGAPEVPVGFLRETAPSIAWESLRLAMEKKLKEVFIPRKGDSIAKLSVSRSCNQKESRPHGNFLEANPQPARPRPE